MAFLVFDQDCPYCVFTARLAGMSEKFEVASYSSEKAQRMLEEGFEEPGFTLYLFEGEKIFFGDKAAQRAAEKFYRSKIAGLFFLKTYPFISKVFSFLSGRENTEQPDCRGKCVVNTETGGIAERNS